MTGNVMTFEEGQQMEADIRARVEAGHLEDVEQFDDWISERITAQASINHSKFSEEEANAFSTKADELLRKIIATRSPLPRHVHDKIVIMREMVGERSDCRAEAMLESIARDIPYA